MFIKTLWIVLIIFQVILTILSYFYKTSLFGDGAFFDFSIAADNPWGMHWKDGVVRISAYLLTAAPVSTIYHTFQLDGHLLIGLYSLSFNVILLLQWSLITYMIWKRAPFLLLLPMAHYSVSVALGYGFPSEMLIAPGFFWICLLSIAQRRSLFIVLGSLILMTFSHELALLGSILAVTCFYFEHKDDDSGPNLSKYKNVFFSAVIGIFGVWIYLKSFGYSGQATDYAVYVFDPRRLVKNSALWIMVAVITAAYLYARYLRRSVRWYDFIVLAVGSLLVSYLSRDVLNYMTGRYETARTLMGVGMLAFGFLFILTMRMSKVEIDEASSYYFQRCFVKLALCSVLISGFLSNLCFLRQWDDLLAHLQDEVDGASPTSQIEFISLDTLAIQDPVLANALLRDRDFAWAWSFLSIMAAESFSPRRIIVSKYFGYANCLSSLSVGAHSRIPDSTMEQFRSYVCAQPKRDNRPRPLINQLRRLLGH